MIESKDWKKWHTLYDNNMSGQAKRLRLVQESIGDVVRASTCSLGKGDCSDPKICDDYGCQHSL